MLAVAHVVSEMLKATLEQMAAAEIHGENGADVELKDFYALSTVTLCRLALSLLQDLHILVCLLFHMNHMCKTNLPHPKAKCLSPSILNPSKILYYFFYSSQIYLLLHSLLHYFLKWVF